MNRAVVLRIAACGIMGLGAALLIAALLLWTYTSSRITKIPLDIDTTLISEGNGQALDPGSLSGDKFVVNQNVPLVSQQQKGRADEHVARLQREGLRTGVTQRLRHLYRVAAALDATTTAKLGVELPPEHRSYQLFIPFAKTMLDIATANKDALVPLGLGATFVDDLGAAVAELDAQSQAATLARARHVGASAELDAATSRAVDLVRILDGFNRDRFGSDAEQLAAWESVISVGVPRRNGVTPVPDPVPGPSPTPVAATSGEAAPAGDTPQQKAA